MLKLGIKQSPERSKGWNLPIARGLPWPPADLHSFMSVKLGNVLTCHEEAGHVYSAIPSLISVSSTNDQSALLHPIQSTSAFDFKICSTLEHHTLQAFIT